MNAFFDRQGQGTRCCDAPFRNVGELSFSNVAFGDVALQAKTIAYVDGS